jgi:hypothetical protein
MRNLPGVTAPIVVRVTACDIKASQDITHPEVIDGRIDTTIYQVNPVIVGGNMSFPLVHEGAALGDGYCAATSDSLAKKMWEIAAKRDDIGRLENVFDADVRYTDNTAFTYPGCQVNTMTFTISQSEAVTVSAEVFGGVNTSSDPRIAYAGLSNPTFLAPARVVTWNDAQVELYDDAGQVVLRGNELREFTASINNGLERYYTLNGVLGPQDIAPKKREMSGTLKLMGRNDRLGTIAYNNSRNFTSRSAIAFGYTLGSTGGGATPYWATAFYGVIFKIEEMAMTTGLFETTTNWRAMGSCEHGYLGTQLGASTALAYPTTGVTNQYGASTAPAFPSF